MSLVPQTEPLATIQIVVDLVQAQMRLPEGAVAIYNQPRPLPPVRSVFVDVRSLHIKTFGAQSNFENPDPSAAGLVEVQSAQTSELFQIDIFSADDSALFRRIDLIFALTGVRAQQAQELYAIKFGSIPTSFVDLSGKDGGRIVTRYAASFTVFRTYTTRQDVEAFTQFSIPPAITVNR